MASLLGRDVKLALLVIVSNINVLKGDGFVTEHMNRCSRSVLVSVKDGKRRWVFISNCKFQRGDERD